MAINRPTGEWNRQIQRALLSLNLHYIRYHNAWWQESEDWMEIRWTNETYCKPEKYIPLDSWQSLIPILGGLKLFLEFKQLINILHHFFLNHSLLPKAACMAPTGWTRVIVEKPFGKVSKPNVAACGQSMTWPHHILCSGLWQLGRPLAAPAETVQRGPALQDRPLPWWGRNFGKTIPFECNLY